MTQQHEHVAEVEASAGEKLLARKLTVWLVLPLALISIVSIVLLWPGQIGDPATSDVVTGVSDSQLVKATVISADAVACDGHYRLDKSCQRVVASLDEGDQAGQIVTFDRSTAGQDSKIEISADDKIVLLETPDAVEQIRYSYHDHVRTAPVAWLVIAFIVCVLIFARRQGLGSLIGLAFTLGVIVIFVVPAILSGRNSVVVAVVAAILMMIVTLYLAHGRGLVTVTALLGTVCALTVSAGLAALWIAASHLFGLASQEAILVSIGAADVNLGSLVLAGVIIGSLGVLDDVTVTQASVVSQLNRSDPRASVGQIMRRGLHVGRDHVASCVNTLILAYAGAALPLFILFNLGDRSLLSVVNSEAVTTEIIRVLVGSLGIIAAVPFTTMLAALAFTRAREMREMATDSRVRGVTGDSESDLRAAADV